MRGYPLYNFPAFFAAAMHLRSLGHEVTNPAEMDMAKGLDPSIPLDDPNQIPFDMSAILKEDFEEILEGEAIVLLPGWEDSTGGNAERVVAHYSGRGIYLYEKDAPGALVQDDLIPVIKFMVEAKGVC